MWSGYGYCFFIFFIDKFIGCKVKLLFFWKIYIYFNFFCVENGSDYNGWFLYELSIDVVCFDVFWEILYYGLDYCIVIRVNFVK